MSSRSKNIYFSYAVGVCIIHIAQSADIISPPTTKRLVQMLVTKTPALSHEEIALEKMNASFQFIRYKKANNALIKSVDKNESYESFIATWNEFTDANYIAKSGKSAAAIACQKGDYSKLQFLMEQRLDPNQSTTLYEYGATDVRVNLIWYTLSGPVHLWNNHFECFKLLLNSPNFNLNNPCTHNENGEAPLHVAVYNKKKEALALLLTKKANPNILDIHNNTPLHWAINNHYFAGIELLIKCGTNINIKNMLDKSPKEALIHLCEHYSLKYNFKDGTPNNHDIACYCLAEQNLKLMLYTEDNL